MAGNEVKLTFAGDATSLTKTFDRVGSGAKEMAGDLDSAAPKARSLGGALDAAGGAADASESKFMGMADLLDGLGGAFGIPTEGATNMMRSMGDLTGGFAVLQPMIGTVSTAMKTGLGGALSFIAAHPVIFTIALLTAALILAWTKSETFRDVVKGAFETVGNAVGTVVGGIRNALESVWNWVSSTWHTIGGLLTAPFNLAKTAASGVMDAFKGAWNGVASFLSGLDFTIDLPDFVPGLPDKLTIGLPDLPRFHSGGTVPGPTGAEMLALVQGGERISPVGGGGGSTTIVLQLDGREITRAVVNEMNREQRTSGVMTRLVSSSG